MKELEKDFREKHEENEELQKRKDKESAKIHRLKLENCWLAKWKKNFPDGLPETVKLQRYTITSFYSEFEDWICFWNQFTVEVDGSWKPKIRKSKYLLALVKGKPPVDILG